MPYKEYLASQQQQQGGTDAGPSAAAAAVAASVDIKLEAAQQQSVAAATAAPTTRSLRSRARSATAVAAAEPRTTRSTRSRQAVPAATPAEQDSAAAAPAQDAPAGDAAPAPPTGQAQLQTLMGPVSPAQPAAAAAAAQASSAAAQKPAMGPPAAAADADARRAAALDRAQAKVDAKLAALGLAAGTVARGADRTVLRQANPGEACFSKNGEWGPQQAVALDGTCPGGGVYTLVNNKAECCATAWVYTGKQLVERYADKKSSSSQCTNHPKLLLVCRRQLLCLLAVAWTVVQGHRPHRPSACMDCTVHTSMTSSSVTFGEQVHTSGRFVPCSKCTHSMIWSAPTIVSKAIGCCVCPCPNLLSGCTAPAHLDHSACMWSSWEVTHHFPGMMLSLQAPHCPSTLT
jgi:hypothetical protein